MWREDRSNASTKYLRNKIRHNIPELKIINPKLIQNFKKTANYLNDTSDLIELAMDDFIDSAIIKVNDYMVFIMILIVLNLNQKPYLYHTFNSYGFTQWDDILSLLDAQPGKYVQSDSHRLLKDRNELILSELLSIDQKGFEINNLDVPVTTIPSGVLHFNLESSPSQKNSLFNICLDLDKLCFPLRVRLSKPGDYFYPHGMEGRKKGK